MMLLFMKRLGCGKISPVGFEKGNRGMLKVTSKRVKERDKVLCRTSEMSLEALTLPVDIAVNIGEGKEIIPLNGEPFNIDKKAKIGGETYLITSKGTRTCFHMSIVTIGLPHGLNISRPVVEREPIAKSSSSSIVLRVRRTLPSGFEMLFSRE